MMASCENEETIANCSFDIKKDNYHCIRIDSNRLGITSRETFEKKLKSSLEKWKGDGVRGIWATIAIQHSEFIPVCVECGFVFHHAQENNVTLKRWLPKTEPDHLPEYANQYLGCGGFVINDKNQLLVIKENHVSKAKWKLPGGLADPGEDIGEAAAREVLEETGVKAELVSVIGFRHMHKFRYGCSDFYFICLMKPLTHEITKCTTEISECKWMDLKEYLSQDITDTNRHFVECYLEMIKDGKCSIQPRPVLGVSKDRYNLVYSIKPFCDATAENLTRPKQILK